MDPHANIQEQRTLATDLINADEPDDGDVRRLAELVLTLDEWRRGGGFDPYTAAAPWTSYEVKGTITLADGSTSNFIIERDSGWQQSGADSKRLTRTSNLLAAMTEAVREHFPDDPEED